MSDAIICALITGGISLFGSVLAIMASAQKQQAEMKTSMAVVEAKMEDMKEDIRAHNQYAKMFQENIPAITQHMADVDRRLENFERRIA